MTIEIKGHVHSMDASGSGEMDAAVTLHLESSRLSEHPHQVRILARRAEIESYKVGMPVIVLVRPA